VGEEAIGVTLPQVKIANNRYCCSSMVTNGSRIVLYCIVALQRTRQFVFKNS